MKEETPGSFLTLRADSKGPHAAILTEEQGVGLQKGDSSGRVGRGVLRKAGQILPPWI